jgi:excisionase family DNA binding protein
VAASLGGALVSTANRAIQQERIAEPRRLRGKWNISPLWEAKILLGVLKQRGLAGKGLVQAFEKWAPTIVGSSRADMNRLYSEQTGREMSDYILVQQADKVVRYNQLPPEAEVFRQALLKSDDSQPCRNWRVTTGIPRWGGPDVPAVYRVGLNVRVDKATGSEHSSVVPALVAERNSTLPTEKMRPLASERQLLDMRDSNALLSTNELASLTGFKPKTIRRWVSRRLLNYIRVGNRFRFRAAAVELFLAQREVLKSRRNAFDG